MLDLIPAPCIAAIPTHPDSKESLQAREPVDTEHHAHDCSSASAGAIHQAKARDFESIDLHEVSLLAPRMQSRRSVSCIELGAADRHRYRTICIGNGSVELQQLAQANVTELLRTAASPAEIDSNNARLARKALRYRKITTPEVENASVLC